MPDLKGAWGRGVWGVGFDRRSAREGDNTYRTRVKFSNSSVLFFHNYVFCVSVSSRGWDLTPGALQ